MPEAINYTLLREETDFCPRRISLIHEPCRKYYYFSSCWRVLLHRQRERERERKGRGRSMSDVSHEHKAHRDAHAVPNSSKGNDVRATSYETYLWGTRYDMFNGRITGPWLLFSHSRSLLPPSPRFTCASNTVINGNVVELVTTQRKNRRWHRYYFITLFIYTQLDGTDTDPSTRIY